MPLNVRQSALYKALQAQVLSGIHALGVPVRATPYLVFAQGRSGSTLLMNLINQHPKAIAEGELLGIPRKNAIGYVNGLAALDSLRHASVQAWGFKAKWWHFTDVQEIDLDDTLAWFHEQGWTFIYLHRKNILKQAISTLVGKQRKQWVFKQGEDGPRKVQIDVDAIGEYVQYRRNQLDIEQAALKPYHPLRITYEDDLLDAGCHQSTADRIFDALDLSLHPVQAQTRRVGGSKIEDYATNSAEVYDEIERLGLAHYL